MKKLRRLPRQFANWLAMTVVILACALPAAALNGQVTYAGGAERFFFLPGSDDSPTDLFPDFKDVMPGDTLQQKILVKNDASNDCKIRIYMRALGAHEDSVEFLSQLHLTVTKGTDTVMFDAPADQTAQLTDWVYLGTLYSGGECELLVTLDVPVTLDNQFQNLAGYLDWEFSVDELPVDPDDPEPPKTGDEGRILLWTGLMVGSFMMLLILLFSRKKKENE